ncbi:hypothetical protein [Mycolicibacterium sp. XJ1819]
MTTAMTFLILLAPFGVVAALSWAASRGGTLRLHLDQFRMAAPMAGRFDDDRDPIRSRFEDRPAWPSSGASGERR